MKRPLRNLLKLDLREKKMLVTTYKEDDLDKATADYLAVEKLEKVGSITDAVLVSFDSMANLVVLILITSLTLVFLSTRLSRYSH